ncbi:hypothetical protein TEA_017423 [Camellia sinensis var. sinensis]|uniref:Non-haem dioxygenase N-terminal domain-containing protein n=1 Tax=Camellia sinensis var. sinensis TaxID=542762 RepID=A0A4S4E7L4_CAMSN|nr:hypothetical protein TEA_017423 [Camellia sinensis var. sinensis]
MEKLVSSWFSIRTIPEGYIFPPDIRPGKLIVPLCKTIPVIDLSMAEARDRNIIIKKVLNASQEFGFFQLINHGVSENLMDETMDLFKEFFDMPADDKASVYSDDPSHLRRLFTSSYNYGHEEHKQKKWPFAGYNGGQIGAKTSGIASRTYQQCS